MSYPTVEYQSSFMSFDPFDSDWNTPASDYSQTWLGNEAAKPYIDDVIPQQRTMSPSPFSSSASSASSTHSLRPVTSYQSEGDSEDDSDCCSDDGE